MQMLFGVHIVGNSGRHLVVVHSAGRRNQRELDEGAELALALVSAA